MAVPLDTSPAAAQLHEEAYRQLGLAGRLRIAFELSDLTHAMAIAGIRRRHPECSDEDARRKLAEMLYGSDAVRQTPEDVLLAKLEYAKLGDSERQLVDAAGIIKVQGDALDTPYIERWVAELGLQQQWAAARNKAV